MKTSLQKQIPCASQPYSAWGYRSCAGRCLAAAAAPRWFENLADVLLDVYPALNKGMLEHTHTAWVHPGTLQKFYVLMCILPQGMLQECFWTCCMRLTLHS